MVKDRTLEETRIREVMEEWLEAFKAKNPERIMECYAEDVVAYDLMPPLQYGGRESYGKLWLDSFAQMPGPIRIDVEERRIVADEDVAFVHGLLRFRGRSFDGNEVDVWSRSTACLRKIDGQWKIAHEHSSVPIDMVTGKGIMDLEP
jgi:uncharacterized protein (TIGR02246 family)